VGSIIGVGLANQFLAPAGTATSGVDWSQATNIGLSLLISPLIGFGLSAVLLLVMKLLVRNKALYAEPKGNQPPPLWIRAILIFTCTGVSFAHGSNDGQKGMGLIMLILIGLVPTAFALNRTPDVNYLEAYKTASAQVETALGKYVKPGVAVADYKAEVSNAVKNKTWTDATTPALQQYIHQTSAEVAGFPTLEAVPTNLVGNVRNDIYLIGEALKLIDKQKLLPMDAGDLGAVTNYHKAVDNATKFIPLWVKVAVAIALGLGTMVGWKRIVVTVGEKDRQDASDLWSGCGSRSRGDGHHRLGRSSRPAGLDDACAVIRRCRHHGGERLRPAMVDRAQHADGLGADAAGLDRDRLRALRDHASGFLGRPVRPWRPGWHCDR
jgi:PiT family inorganic phosphate transporter